jgi:hypothetical protein
LPFGRLAQEQPRQLTAGKIAQWGLALGLASIASLAQGAVCSALTPCSIAVVDANGRLTASITGAQGSIMNGSTTTSPTTFYGGGGAGYVASQFIGGSGNDLFLAGAGSGQFTGGAGADAFAFAVGTNNAAARYVVTDFVGASPATEPDSLFVVGGSFTAAQMLLNAAVLPGGGVRLTLSNGAQITFSNLSSTAALNGRIQVSPSNVPTSAREGPAAAITANSSLNQPTAASYTVFSTGTGVVQTPLGDTVTGSAGFSQLTVSGNSVSGLALTASNDGFNLQTAAGDTFLGKAGVETITSTGGVFTLLGTINGETLALGASTHTIRGTAASLNLDTIANLGLNDQVVITGVRFGAIHYNSTTGLLRLDTNGDGSFATSINLAAGLLGNFVATPSAAGGDIFTTVTLAPVPEASSWLMLLLGLGVLKARTRRSRR